MVSPAEALKLSVSLLGRWRGFPTVDPDLPREYLPADWPRRAARRLFVQVHDACVAPATEHVRSVVAKYDPAAAAAVQGLTVAEAIELHRRRAAAVGASGLGGHRLGRVRPGAGLSRPLAEQRCAERGRANAARGT